MFIISFGESSDFNNKLEMVLTQALLVLCRSKFITFILIISEKSYPYFAYLLGMLLAVSYVRANTIIAFNMAVLRCIRVEFLAILIC